MNDTDLDPDTPGFILVVEDDLALRESFEDILQFANYNCIAVPNPHEALRALRSLAALPRLIISDILMPGMDGFQFLASVRANPMWERVPFLFVSGQEATNLMEDRSVGYLSKPFDVPELLEMVALFLAGNGVEFTNAL